MAVNLNKSLITLEVLQMPEDLETEEEIMEFYDKNVITKTHLISDTSVPYVIRVSTADKRQVRSLDPEYLPEMDAYEISESIQDILRDEGFAVHKHKFPEQPGQELKSSNSQIEVEIVEDINQETSLADIFSPKPVKGLINE